MAHLFLVIVVMCGCLAASSFGDGLQLVFIHTNDVHARIEQTSQYNGAECQADDLADDNCYGGLARMWTKIQELRQQYPDNSLLLDAGDQFQGSLWATHYKGQETSYFMNLMGYDIMTLGNHEFDYGLPALKRFLDNVTFPVVVSNMEAGDTVLSGAVVKSRVFTVKGVKVGVVGYTKQGTPVLEKAVLDGGLRFTDEVEAVKREAATLKSQGVNIIIALGHSGLLVDKKVAEEVTDVDIVIGGHTHTFLYTGSPPSNEVPFGDYPIVVKRSSGGKALGVTAFAYGKYLGYLKVTFTDQGEVSSWEGQPILLNSGIHQDAVMNARIAIWSKPLESIKEAVIGETYVKLEGDSSGYVKACRIRECSLGNVVTDAILWSYYKDRPPNADSSWSDVSVAVWNGGGIRIDLKQGPITLADVLVALPFRNLVKLVIVTGSILRQMLENSVSVMKPWPSGRYLQMSGLKVTYNMDKPIGERVIAVKVQCSECSVPRFDPLESTKIYRVLVNSFMASGGSGYDMISTAERIDIDTLGSDALIEYIKEFSPITTGLQGRIEFVTEGEHSPPVPCAGNKPISPPTLTLIIHLILYI